MKDFKTKTISVGDDNNETSATETQGVSTSQNVNDLQGIHKTEDSSLCNQSSNTEHVDAKLVVDGGETKTDSDRMCLIDSGGSDSKRENLSPDEESLTAGQQDGQMESALRNEKKTDFSATKTFADASQIVADVVESIEQESAPPVAPPRRRRKKKKSDGDTQVNIN